MRILHVPYTYYPDACGGTEVYVRALAAEQTKQGYHVEVAAPSRETKKYQESGLTVHRFGISAQLTLEELYGEGDPVASNNFDRILASGDRDVVHLHALTSAISVKSVLALKARKIPVVFTYHTPTVSCLRGTLLKFGESVCSGQLTERNCAGCTLHSAGLGRLAAEAMALVPAPVSRVFGNSLAGANHRLETMFNLPGLVNTRKRTLHTFFENADAVVAVCEWVRRVLLINGVRERKISLVRQGLAAATEERRKRPSRPGKPCRFLFLGRLSATKGITMFARALSATAADVSLDVYGVVQDEEGSMIRNELASLAARDSRIRICDPVSPNEVVNCIAGYDCLVVPSQWLETGPLVIYEAFAASVPILGSDLGGIAELVTNGVNGILVPYNSERHWREAIERVAKDPECLGEMSAALPSVRTMKDVAREMEPIYRSVVSRAA